jgi:hypothetical protein
LQAVVEILNKNNPSERLTMVDCQAGMEAIAAISSAIAAIASVFVAKIAFSFQRNMLLKREEIDRLLDLIGQLHYLKSLAHRSAFDVNDEDVSKLGSRLLQARSCLATIESMASESAGSGITRVRDILNGMHESRIFAIDDKTPNAECINNLDVALFELRKLYRMETK